MNSHKTSRGLFIALLLQLSLSLAYGQDPSHVIQGQTHVKLNQLYAYRLPYPSGVPSGSQWCWSIQGGELRKTETGSVVATGSFCDMEWRQVWVKWTSSTGTRAISLQIRDISSGSIYLSTSKTDTRLFEIENASGTRLSCISDHALRLTNGPYDNVAWSVKDPSTNASSSKARVAPSASGANDVVGFFWSDDPDLVPNDQVLIEATFTINSPFESGTATMLITFMSVTADVSPKGEVLLPHPQTVTTLSAIPSTGYTYQWYKKNQFSSFNEYDHPDAKKATISNVPFGEYYVRLGNGTCSDNSDQVLVRGSLPDPSHSNPIICEGGQVTVSCTLSNCVVSWYHTLNEKTPFHTGQSYGPTATETVFVETSIEGYRSNRKRIDIIVIDSDQTLAVTPEGPIELYPDDPLTLSSVGINGYNDYQWQFQSIGQWLNLSGENDLSFDVSSPGRYRLLGQGICGDKPSNFVVVSGVLYPPILEKDKICADENINVTCDPDSGPCTVRWFNVGATTPFHSGFSFLPTDVSAGTVTYQVQSINGSYVSPKTTIVVSIITKPPTTDDTQICLGESITAACDPACGPCTIRWFNVGAGDAEYFHSGESYTPPAGSVGTMTYEIQGVYTNYITARKTISVEIINQPLQVTVDKTTIFQNETVHATILNYHSGTTYYFYWNDGQPRTSNRSGSAAHQYITPGTFTLRVDAGGEECFSESTVTINVKGGLCASSFPVGDGSFKLDKLTGNIVFIRTNCPAQSLMTCTNGPALIKKTVVRSDATTFADQWSSERYPNISASVLSNLNPFQKGDRGKWRVKSTYSHNTHLTADDKNFKAGTYQLQHFTWSNESANSKKKWLLGSSVTAYSPHGDALSEKNILNTESVAKFGYRNAVPYLTAQNSSYENVVFESFENSYGSEFEDKIYVYQGDIETTIVPHSGLNSFKMSNRDFSAKELVATSQILSKGLLLKVWIRVSTADLTTLTTDLKVVLKKETAGTIVATKPVTIIARNGEWLLCEALITNFGTLEEGKTFTPYLDYKVGGTYWLDDLRIQPADAEMSCYVYDKKTLKLLTVFDDQHFGLYYQYNPDGKLIRKMVETERGMKTVQETHYNTKLVDTGAQ